jgi:hypothetical protein
MDFFGNSSFRKVQISNMLYGEWSSINQNKLLREGESTILGSGVENTFIVNVNKH